MKPTSRILLYIVSRNRCFGLLLSIATTLILSLIACGPPPPAVIPLTTPLPTPSPKPVKEGLDTAYFLNRMADFTAWAYRRPNERAVLRSSFNTDEGAEDADHFIAVAQLEGATWNILLDETGPGCVTRIWITGHASGRLRFYFDQDSKPRIDTTLAEFFSGKYQHFQSYLTYPPSVSGGGNLSYFPLPFSQRCIIMTDCLTSGFKYQIQTLRLDPNTKVSTYNPTLDAETETALKHLNEIWGSAAPSRFMNLQLFHQEVEIAPQQKKLIFNAGQSGALDYFQLQLNPLTAETVNGLKIQAYWDNLVDPCINCTLRQFYGMFKEVRDWNSIPLGFWGKQNVFYSQFYMPFQTRGQIYLENTTNTPLKIIVNYHVDWKTIPDDFLYFYVLPNQRQFNIGNLYPLLNFEGPGNLVGLNILVAQPKTGLPFFVLEGDESLYMDGESKPSWCGTGLDGYIGGDDLFKNYSPFWVPTHGCVVRDATDIEIVQGYRFMLLDAVPFQSSLTMVEEIGCPIKFSSTATVSYIPTNYEWVAYVYGKPAETKPKRQEYLSYYVIDKEEKTNPTRDCPVMQYQRLWVKIPAGEWMIHLAPIWDLNQVHHQKLVKN